MDYNSYQEDKFYLPRISDKIYKEINSFEDFEFRNNIAFEALIRTRAYQDLRNMEYSERVIAAEQLGFNESDAKYAGLPWMIFKILREDRYYDKKGHALELQIRFLVLIEKYSKEEKLTEPINCFKKIFTYYVQKEVYPLDEILNFYTMEDMYLLQIIIDGFYEIFFYYYHNNDDMLKCKEAIENSFNRLILSCVETSTYTLKNVVVENILDGYTDKNLYTLEDIHNGLDKLLTFYYQVEKVFTYTGEKVQHINKNIILNNLDKCLFVLVSNSNSSDQGYILLLSESEESFGSDNEAKKATSIVSNIKKFKFRDYHQVKMVASFSTDIFLRNINDFVFQLKQSDIKNKKEIINLTFKRPLLTFYENNIAKIKVDMNLPHKDFMDFMKNIKNKYDKNNNIIKNTLELINREIKNKDAILTKKNISDAFFCYDYYHMRLKQTRSKNNYIQDENDNDSRIQELKDNIEKINNNELYSRKEKNKQILEIKNILKGDLIVLDNVPVLLKISPNFVFDEEIFKESNINPHTASKYYHKIVPYLSNDTYSSVIVDFK